MIEMLHGHVLFLRIGVVGRSVRVTEGLGGSALLARRGDTEQFCEPQFVSLANRRLAIRLNPFGMFPAQGFMYLLLKLKVCPDLVGNR